MYISRRALLGASAATLALGAAGCNQQNGDLHAILDAAVINFLRESPEFATSLAVPE